MCEAKAKAMHPSTETRSSTRISFLLLDASHSAMETDKTSLIFRETLDTPRANMQEETY